jgi:hypothetical protein
MKFPLPERYKKLVIFISLIPLVFLALFVSFRNNLLHYAIDKVAEKVRHSTGSVLTVGEAGFSGFMTVGLKDISLVPLKGDTLFKGEFISIRPSFWTLFIGVIRIKEVHASSIKVTVSCRNNSCNYSGFIHEKKSATSKGERNYALFLKRLLDRAFNFAPQRSEIKNASFEYLNDSLNEKITLKEFNSDENKINVLLMDEKSKSTWACQGRFSQIHHSFNISLYALENRNSTVPILNSLLGLTIRFDTLHAGLNEYTYSKNKILTSGSVAISNLNVFHRKISNDTVNVPAASFDFKFNAGKNYFELDSNSLAKLSDITFNPYIRYFNDTYKEYILYINTDKIEAGNFFSSLPKGMFDEVWDITASGKLQFQLRFHLNASEPDKLIFNSSLVKEKFRIKSYGSSALNKLNEEFLYSVYEKDRFIRSFLIGPSNPNFSSLDSISDHFKYAVLTSEDGNFYSHNGFNEEAFRKSIIANFKAGKFVRGGSTISMQLVKNVFLSRKKTVARKAEEILIVWLMESNRISSKERMFEVYLNIIELGPDVYGIAEASDFYFRKKPSEINLEEGIYLASLLPKPKWFKYSFDTLGNLKPYLGDYYRIVSGHMLRRNQITQEDFDKLMPNVKLTGRALDWINPKDSIFVLEEPDSSDIQSTELLLPNDLIQQSK